MKEIDDQTKDKRSKKYNIWARKRPTYIFIAIPILLAVAMGIKEIIVNEAELKDFTYLLPISAISTALLFLLGFTLRDIAKVYPEKLLFCDRLKPTNRLLYSDDDGYTEEKKHEILKKIKAKKNIDLLKFKTKTYKNKKYVKRVDEAVSWLLDVTRFDEILFEYNCIYGFWRNLTAAFLAESLFLFGLAAVNKWVFVLPFGNAFIWLAAIVLLISVWTTFVTYKNGMVFAKRVYDVFMNLNDDNQNY